MLPSLSPRLLSDLATLGQAASGLELLLLFGSRARTDARPDSDWDFGYLATEPFDLPTLWAALIELVGSDRVDLVDLARASGLLRYQAARDGQCVFEARARTAEKFCLEAARFWSDAEPVLRQGYEDVLDGLKP
ncbi:MAG: nucleotidyltransferase domain-containing protein [Candidatus Eisenbacteria bacterium]